MKANNNYAIVLSANDCRADILLCEIEGDEDGNHIIPNSIEVLHYDTFVNDKEKKKLRRGDLIDFGLKITKAGKIEENTISDLEFDIVDRDFKGYPQLVDNIDYYKEEQKRLSKTIDKEGGD
jgi:hypothetical protein